jgi:hypothetical protein
MRAGIDERGYAFTGRQTVLFVLGFDGFCAAALANLFFFILDDGEEFHHALGILFESG